jgi:hypothetical protein
MNVIKIFGGLGNQFFQYAFGETMRDKGKDVTYEMSFYDRPQDPPRPYCLDKFKTRDIVRTKFLTGNATVHEKADMYYKFDPSIMERDHCNFFGYWQNLGYFESILPRLRKEFKLKKEFYTPEFNELVKEIDSVNSISLHIRRGDYIAINGHYNLQLDYYDEALSKFKPSGGIFIFSDDIPWCKEHIKDAIYIDLNEYLSFELMRRCKHNIIANSTFSWWAAFLNENPDKIVVSPNRWRKSDQEQSQVDAGVLLINDWIRI